MKKTNYKAPRMREIGIELNSNLLAISDPTTIKDWEEGNEYDLDKQ